MLFLISDLRFKDANIPPPASCPSSLTPFKALWRIDGAAASDACNPALAFASCAKRPEGSTPAGGVAGGMGGGGGGGGALFAGGIGGGAVGVSPNVGGGGGAGGGLLPLCGNVVIDWGRYDFWLDTASLRTGTTFEQLSPENVLR